MAATGIVQLNSSPSKKRVLIDIKCAKCNKIVRNGILCDMCDLWHHFRCASVEESNLPEENSEWKCPKCCETKTTNMASSNVSSLDSSVNADMLLTIINELKEDNVLLKEEIMRLKKNCEDADLELSKQIAAKEDTSRTHASTIVDKPNSISSSNRRWEPVPSTKSFKHNYASFPYLISSPIPFHKNKFAVLSPDEDNDCKASRPSDDSNNTTYNTSVKPIIKKQKVTRGYAQKNHKIKLYCDSHGRALSSLISENKIGSKCKIEAWVKPSATFAAVTSEVEKEAAEMTEKDFVVIIGGANDVYRNETIRATSSLKQTLTGLVKTNVIVAGIPRRHDLKDWSIVNKEVREANNRYNNICSSFSNVSFVDLSNFKRELFTSHGLHLNKKGKHELSKIISSIVLSKLSLSVDKMVPVDYEDKSFLG